RRKCRDPEHRRAEAEAQSVGRCEAGPKTGKAARSETQGNGSKIVNFATGRSSGRRNQTGQCLRAAELLCGNFSEHLPPAQNGDRRSRGTRVDTERERR